MPNKTIKLHDKQYQAFNFETQFGGAICGVQSGKTFVGGCWANKKVGEFPKGTGLIAAPTHKILMHSTLDKFFDLVPEYQNYWNKAEGVIQLPTGGKIYLRSTDNPEGIEGMTLNWAWLDEAGQMSRRVWLYIRARVSTTRGQVFLTSTPYTQNWFYTDFFTPWKNGTDDDISVFTWPSTDNKHFSKDYYEKERKRLSIAEFARRYEGEFTKMEGLVYDLRKDCIIEPKEVRREITIAGVDWGWRNPSAVVVLTLADQVWYVVDEYYEVEKTTEEIASACALLAKKHKINRFYPDPAEPDRIAVLKRLGLYCMESDKALKPGISHVQQMFNEGRIQVFNTCKNFIEECNMYHYPEDPEDKNSRDEPEKVNDHLLDAARYALYTYKPVSTIDQTLNVVHNRRRKYQYL